MNPICIGLAFNLRGSGGREGPEDAEAEYDSWSTVSALAEALSFGGAFSVALMPVEGDFARLVERYRPDAVFNIAEGQFGRSRELLAPAVLEMMGVPYTGSDPVALGVAMDKSLAKMVAQAAGVPTAPWQVVTDPSEVARAGSEWAFPAFVKPVAEGSSKGVRRNSRVDDVGQLAERVAWVLRTYGQPALVESYLPGREFSVGILGNRVLRTLPVLEVRPTLPVGSTAEFVYCYHTKSGNLETFLCPAPIEPALEQKLHTYTQAIFRALSLRDVARVDFRLDADGEPRFLEVNPLPGLSAASLLTAQGEAAGLGVPALVACILLAAISRWLSHPSIDAERRRRLSLVAEAARAAIGPAADPLLRQAVGALETVAGNEPSRPVALPPVA